MDSPLVFPVVFAAGAALLVVLAGLPPLVARATVPATAAEAAAGLVRWLAVVAAFGYLVPR